MLTNIYTHSLTFTYTCVHPYIHILKLSNTHTIIHTLLFTSTSYTYRHSLMQSHQHKNTHTFKHSLTNTNQTHHSHAVLPTHSHTQSHQHKNTHCLTDKNTHTLTRSLTNTKYMRNMHIWTYTDIQLDITPMETNTGWIISFTLWGKHISKCIKKQHKFSDGCKRIAADCHSYLSRIQKHKSMKATRTRVSNIWPKGHRRPWKAFPVLRRKVFTFYQVWPGSIRFQFSMLCKSNK